MKVIDRDLLKHTDWLTIALVLSLFTIGIISIASIMASPFSGTEQSVSDYMSKLNMEYVERQLVNFAVGAAVMILVTVIDYHLFKSLANILYVAIVALLLILVVVGKTSRGVAGWFVLSKINRAIQPAEMCKVVLMIMFAKILSQSIDQHGKLKDFKSIVLAIVACAVPTALVCWQPDFGTAFVFICILVMVLFMSGVSWKYIIPTVALAAIVAPLVYLFILKPEQQNRIKVFLDPELDPQGAGYNVIQSKLSIGSGQLWGKGYFTEGTMAQLKYVPERHTDFIFSGIVEAIGFVGGVIIILLFFALILRWIAVGYMSGDAFGMCICIGAAAMIMAHVFENIGMTIGLMPVTGIPLPFISYGGSNLLTSLMATGLVVNVYMRRPIGRNLSDRTQPLRRQRIYVPKSRRR